VRAAAAVALLIGLTFAPASAEDAPLVMVIMDPLAVQLACECVEGYAQRDYLQLETLLEARLGREVQTIFAESIPEAMTRAAAPPHLVIGKRSVVEFDASAAGLALRPLAMLTGKQGETTLTGLFVVRRDDPAQTIEDIADHRIVLGPREATEKHAAALEALGGSFALAPDRLETRATCNSAAAALLDGDADAAVISSYALPLFEGCDIVDRGDLRVVGSTAPVPFVTAFVTEHLPTAEDHRVLDALMAATSDVALLHALESRDGFVPVAASWADWRGPSRDAISPYVPDSLPDEARFLWRTPLQSITLSGVAVADGRVVVADKSADQSEDIFICLDVETGAEVWRLSYVAAEDMDYTNSSRAAPVISGERAWLLGAFGDLHCVDMGDGEVIWKRNIFADFGAETLQWGSCATPLLVGGRLIVNPGAPEASLVALDAASGKVIWQTPGPGAAYSSFIVGVFGGTPQIVGYDAVSLGGWDIATGTRLWQLRPDFQGDFNVPTPVDLGGRLLVATENNGTRVYAFNDDGTIIADPAARNEEFAPDTVSPVVVDGLVFGAFSGLMCLDTADELKTVWRLDEDALRDHVSLIGGNGRVLAITEGGELLLLPAQRGAPADLDRLQVWDKAEVWSHPALLDGRLYIRNHDELACLLLD